MTEHEERGDMVTDIQDRLLVAADAQVWAREFMRIVESGAKIHEDLMIGWFANAFETAKQDQMKNDHSWDRHVGDHPSCGQCTLLRLGLA